MGIDRLIDIDILHIDRYFYSDKLPAGLLGFDFLQGQEIFLYPTAARPALRPI
jgi:hypothetical protein